MPVCSFLLAKTVRAHQKPSEARGVRASPAAQPHRGMLGPGMCRKGGGIPGSPGRAGGSNETSRAQGFPPLSPRKQLCCRGDGAGREQQQHQVSGGKICQGQGGSWGQSHPGLAGLGFTYSRWLDFFGSCRCCAALTRLNLLLPLTGSLCSEHDGTQGLPQLRSQGVIAQI